MSTRTRLLLSALACLLCIVIVLSTDQPQRPFQRLTEETIAAFEVETAVGVSATVSDPESLRSLAGLLRDMIVYRHIDADGTLLAAYSIFTQDGKEYHLAVYDGFISLDGLSCSADPAHTEKLSVFARQFAG